MFIFVKCRLPLPTTHKCTQLPAQFSNGYQREAVPAGLMEFALLGKALISGKKTGSTFIDPAPGILSPLIYPILLLKLLCQLCLFVMQVNLPALYKSLCKYIGFHIKYVAFTYNNVCVFTFFNAACSVGNT